MNKITVADFIFNYLSELGLKNIFLLPGGGAMHLNDAVIRNKKIKPIVCHHEQAVGIAAESYGRTNNLNFGVALVTSGPGSTNILTPFAGAWIESLPLMVISGQAKRKDLINKRKIRQGGVQEVCITKMIQSISKYAVTIKNPNTIRYHLKKALYEMLNLRPGPVWLDIPLDVQASPINPNYLIDFTPKKNFSLSSDKQTKKFTKFEALINKSKRPLILAGHGVRLSNGQKIFKKIINKIKIPCVLTWNSTDLLEWENNLNIGRPGVVASRAPNFAIQNCDLLIVIGSRVDNVITAYNPNNFAKYAKKIIVDIDNNEILNNKINFDLRINMDAKDFLSTFMSNITIKDKKNLSNWSKKCLNWKLKYPANENLTEVPKDKIGHYFFIDSLSEVLPTNSIIATGSSGLAIETFYSSFKNKANQRIFLTSGLGSMGYGLASSIGSCIGSGYKETFCIESDGSLMLNIQELATIKYLNLPIFIIILNNQGYCSIKNTQKNYFNSRFCGVDKNSGLFIPNISKVANSFGIKSIKFESKKNLAKNLNKILTINKGPILIEIILHPDESLLPKASVIQNNDGSLSSMPLEDMSPLLTIEELEKEMINPLSNISFNVRKK